MPLAAAIPWIVSGIGALASAYSSNKAAQATKDAAKSSQVDISALDAKTREIALRNAQDSAALERMMTPEVPELRTAANNSVLRGLSDNSMDGASALLNGSLGQDVAGPVSTPLLQAAIAKAKANLELGGKIDADTQNAVTRKGLANAAQVGGGGLGLGRDVVARDLGLTSLQLQQQRLEDAGRLGAQELGIGQENNNTAFNNSANLLNRIQLLRAISDGTFGRGISAAQYGQSIQQPIVGLDPSAVANIAVGNANNQGAASANQANIYGAQSSNYANLAGNALGYGLLNYNRSTPTTTGGNSSYNDMAAAMNSIYKR